jgi:hypothetical protein
MKTLNKITLRKGVIMDSEEMKLIGGGNPYSIIANTCNVGFACSVYDQSDGSTTSGTCQGSTSSAGTVTCFCDSYGMGSGSGNISGMSHCFKGN